MNQVELQSYIRGAIYAFGVTMVNQGWINADQWGGISTLLAGVVVILIGIVMSRVQNAIPAIIGKLVASKKVEAVITTPTIAANDSSPKVVGPTSPGAQLVISAVAKDEGLTK